MDLRDCARLHRNQHGDDKNCWGDGGESHERVAYSARPPHSLHMPQHIQHRGCSLECLSNMSGASVLPADTGARLSP